MLKGTPAFSVEREWNSPAPWSRIAFGSGEPVFLTRLEGQCHFCDAAGDIETLATFDAERLQRD